MKFLFGQRNCKKIKIKKEKIIKKRINWGKKKFSVSFFFFWPSSAQSDTQY